MKNYCFYCMRENDNSTAVCPHCGKAPDYESLSHHLQAGTMLKKKYLLGSVIGEGGFGITYIGFDTVLKMRIAIKEYYPNGYVNRSAKHSTDVIEGSSEKMRSVFNKGKKNFLSEARTLAKFAGKEGIVSVRDFFEANNTAYLVMEFIDGITLTKYLKDNGPMSAERTVELMQPVMKALKGIHEHDIIHRDISPNNIMITKGGKVKLIDFGSARGITNEINRTMAIMYTPGYAPEEQHRSKGIQGPWTDIYSLCAVMYKCITNVVPLDASDRAITDTLQMPSELGIDIPEHIEETLEKGLAVRSSDRFRNMDELIASFEQNSTPAKTTKRKRWLEDPFFRFAIAFFVLVLLMVAVKELVFYLVDTSQAQTQPQDSIALSDSSQPQESTTAATTASTSVSSQPQESATAATTASTSVSSQPQESATAATTASTSVSSQPQESTTAATTASTSVSSQPHTARTPTDTTSSMFTITTTKSTFTYTMPSFSMPSDTPPQLPDFATSSYTFTFTPFTGTTFTFDAVYDDEPEILFEYP